jgi:hypothetical protein
MSSFYMQVCACSLLVLSLFRACSKLVLCSHPACSVLLLCSHNVPLIFLLYSHPARSMLILCSHPSHSMLRSYPACLFSYCARTKILTCPYYNRTLLGPSLNYSCNLHLSSSYCPRTLFVPFPYCDPPRSFRALTVFAPYSFVLVTCSLHALTLFLSCCVFGTQI